MNVLCATRCIVFENRWNLLMAAAAVGLGYLMGRYYVADGRSVGKSADYIATSTTPTAGYTFATGLTTADSSALRLSADCWRVIVSKIVKLAADVEDLRELVAGIQHAPADLT